jgi:hypothetical protein
MKKMHVESVSANQSGDYFQVYFGNDGTHDKDDNYFLIQWGIEFDDEIDEPRYIESNDESYIGHVRVKKATLSRNNFYIQVVKGKETKEIKITFPDQDKNEFREVERILEVIIPNITIEKKENC